jgi:hypothetical protein
VAEASIVDVDLRFAALTGVSVVAEEAKDEVASTTTDTTMDTAPTTDTTTDTATTDTTTDTATTDTTTKMDTTTTMDGNHEDFRRKMTPVTNRINKVVLLLNAKQRPTDHGPKRRKTDARRPTTSAEDAESVAKKQ